MVTPAVDGNASCRLFIRCELVHKNSLPPVRWRPVNILIAELEALPHLFVAECGLGLDGAANEAGFHLLHAPQQVLGANAGLGAQCLEQGADGMPVAGRNNCSRLRLAGHTMLDVQQRRGAGAWSAPHPCP